MQNYPVVMSAAGGSNLGPMTFPIHLRRSSHPDSLLELEMQLQEILDRPPSVISMLPIVTPHENSSAPARLRPDTLTGRLDSAHPAELTVDQRMTIASPALHPTSTGD